MRINILRIILFILLIWTFSIIFGFSNQNGEQSGGLSKKVTEIILFRSDKYNNLEESKKETVFHRVEKIIRKLAHFSIYTLVGFLLMGLASTFNNFQMRERCGISLIIGILYAIADEIHQSFIPGRSPLITDVFIDSLGIILGILIIVLIVKIYEKTKSVSHKVT